MTQEMLSYETTFELWKDSMWDPLLESLEKRSVIPIVGPDLLQVEIDGTTMLLDQYIARRLAETYKLSVDSLPADRALNHVVCQATRRLHKDRFDICEDIFPIMREAAVAAIETSAATGRDHRFQPLRFHDVRFTAGECDQRGAVWGAPGSAVHFLLA